MNKIFENAIKHSNNIMIMREIIVSFFEAIWRAQ